MAVVIKKLLSGRRKGGLWQALPPPTPTQLQVGGTLLQEHHAERARGLRHNPSVSLRQRAAPAFAGAQLSLYPLMTPETPPTPPSGGIVISSGLIKKSTAI